MVAMQKVLETDDLSREIVQYLFFPDLWIAREINEVFQAAFEAQKEDLSRAGVRLELDATDEKAPVMLNFGLIINNEKSRHHRELPKVKALLGNVIIPRPPTATIAANCFRLLDTYNFSAVSSRDHGELAMIISLTSLASDGTWMLQLRWDGRCPTDHLHIR